MTPDSVEGHLRNCLQLLTGTADENEAHLRVLIDAARVRLQAALKALERQQVEFPVHERLSAEKAIADLRTENARLAQALRIAQQKLAIAGVEGSPPPGMETTIGRLLGIKGKLAANVAKLRKAAEWEVHRHGHFHRRGDMKPCECHLCCAITETAP